MHVHISVLEGEEDDVEIANRDENQNIEAMIMRRAGG